MAHSKISYRVKIDNATMALTCLLWIGVFFVVQLVIFNELYDKTHHIAALLYEFFLLTSLDFFHNPESGSKVALEENGKIREITNTETDHIQTVGWSQKRDI
jgi:hypothetical protein